MEKTTDLIFLYSTFPNKKAALMAARVLVEKHLIACANIADNVTSVYRWDGKLQEEKEVTLVAKTRYDAFSAAAAELKKLHPYAVPCIVALPVTDGHMPFLQWVSEETK